MLAKEVKFYWKELKTGTVYDENIAIPPDATSAESYIKDLLVKFNEEEDRRHKTNPEYTIYHREFVRIEGETGKQAEIMVRCNLNKVNMVTVTRGDSSYDILQCKNCKLMIRRFTLETPEPFCFSDRVCNECNKLFKTARNLILHNKRGSHRLPDWYPDGI